MKRFKWNAGTDKDNSVFHVIFITGGRVGAKGSLTRTIWDRAAFALATDKYAVNV